MLPAPKLTITVAPEKLTLLKAGTIAGNNATAPPVLDDSFKMNDESLFPLGGSRTAACASSWWWSAAGSTSSDCRD